MHECLMTVHSVATLFYTCNCHLIEKKYTSAAKIIIAVSYDMVYVSHLQLSK